MQETKLEIAYNPSAVVNIFNNALSNEAARKIILMRGIYVPGKGHNYNGVYYDYLKDETSDACITFIVPALLRTKLEADKTIECHAYLTKKVQANGARIELQLNMTELLAQKESLFTEDDIKAFRILQRKAELGYRDVDSFVKTKIIGGESIKIIILFGKNGIIHDDIKDQLREAISFYDFEFVRINLGSEDEIIRALEQHHAVADLLVVSRGGGDNIGIFNKPNIAETALSLSSHFITAIGHQQDNPLLQKVADKSFITPTALGQYFNEIYNRTMEELQNSKAKLVDDITKQLQANYAHQIKNLEEQIKAKEEAHQKQGQSIEELYQKEISLLKTQAETITAQSQTRVAELQKMHDEKLSLAKNANSNTTIYWILIIAACIIGIFIGKGCH